MDESAIGRGRSRAGRTAGTVGYTPAVTSQGRPAGRGRFITFEGPEGGGKTTQAARLRDTLDARRIPVVLTREPGGTAIGERIRRLVLAAERGTGAGGGFDMAPLDPRTDALLFNAARAQLVADVVRPALARGEVVVCARFADSTLAYQGFGSGLALDDLGALERFATGGLRPDLTLLLDLPVDLGLARKGVHEHTRFETAFDRAFHERVREGFLELARRDPERFVVVDASGEPDAVHEAAVDALAGRLGLAVRGSSEPPALAERMNR